MRETAFWERLLGNVAPSPALLGAFAIGLMIVGILGNFLYDVLVTPAGLDRAAVGRTLVALLGLVALAYLLYHRDLHARRYRLRVTDRPRPICQPGLIAILGPRRPSLDALYVAIAHHHKSPKGAQHLWLIGDSSQQVMDRLRDIEDQIRARGWRTHCSRIPCDQPTVEASHAATKEAIRKAQTVGLLPSQLVADITGGLKPLSIGVALAALEKEVMLQYIESEHGPDGNYIPGTAQPFQVDYGFYRNPS